MPVLPADSMTQRRCGSENRAGTVMSAWSTSKPRYRSASALTFERIAAANSSGSYYLPPSRTLTVFPSRRLTRNSAEDGSASDWFFADEPVRSSLFSDRASADGVAR